MPTVSLRTIAGGNPNGDESGAVGLGFNTTSGTISAFDGTTLTTFPSTVSTSTLTNKTLTSPTITGPTVSSVTNSDYKVTAAAITYDSKPTAAVITGFSWTVAAAGTYLFEVDLPTTMTTVGGLTVSFKLTTATLTSIDYHSYATTASDNTTAVSTSGTTTTDATAIFDSKTAAYTRVRLWGTMVVNAGGTFAFFGTQNTSGTSGDVTTIKLGAYAKMVRVA